MSLIRAACIRLHDAKLTAEKEPLGLATALRDRRAAPKRRGAFRPPEALVSLGATVGGGRCFQ